VDVFISDLLALTTSARQPIFADDMTKTPQLAKITCRHCEGLGYRWGFNPSWARREREKARLTLRAVAVKMGVSAAYLSDMELGRRPFTEEMEEKFREAINA
jgi:hypothetical protein